LSIAPALLRVTKNFRDVLLRSRGANDMRHFQVRALGPLPWKSPPSVPLA
jgi:hypothetical protein